MGAKRTFLKRLQKERQQQLEQEGSVRRGGEFLVARHEDDQEEQERSGQNRTSALGEAESFLAQMLRDGPVEANAVKDEATAWGIAGSTLKRARRSLGVASVRQGEVWLWKLPEGEEEANEHFLMFGEDHEEDQQEKQEAQEGEQVSQQGVRTEEREDEVNTEKRAEEQQNPLIPIPKRKEPRGSWIMKWTPEGPITWEESRRRKGYIGE